MGKKEFVRIWNSWGLSFLVETKLTCCLLFDWFKMCILLYMQSVLQPCLLWQVKQSAVYSFDIFVKALRFFSVNDISLSRLSPSAFHTCQPTAFTCGNGRCVPYPYRCDHYNDCGDNSDEVGCLFRTCDSHTEFTCNNGRCISLEYVCNGVNNCYDNGTSDERNCRKLIQLCIVLLGYWFFSPQKRKLFCL